jgi:hypothetical protein
MGVENVSRKKTSIEAAAHFLHIFANPGAGAGEYTFGVTLSGQNDAGTGGDVNTIHEATPLTPSSYTGYMDVNDLEDWYSFSASPGQGIFITIEPLEKSDYDIHLYKPNGDLVYSTRYYRENELEYPADAPGRWKINFLYSCGAYELTLSIGGTAKAPPGFPQKDITPVVQTSIVDDDLQTNKNEYGYIAAIPAANYIKVSPKVYRGVDHIPGWFTTVDQTTQYLLNDWNTYLARHGMQAKEYIIPSDPIKAAVACYDTRGELGFVPGLLTVAVGWGLQKPIKWSCCVAYTRREIIEEVRKNPKVEIAYPYTEVLLNEKSVRT